MNEIKPFFTAILLFFSISATCQSEKMEDIDLQQIIDEYFPEGLNDNPEAYETIFNNYQNQYELNSITREELESLLIFSEFQINSFIWYRQKYGPIMSIFELQALEGFDQHDIHKLLLFCHLKKNPNLLRSDNSLKHKIILRYQGSFPEKEGFKRSDSTGAPFSGNPRNYFVRYLLKKGKNLEGGFTLDKDAGEQMKINLKEKQYLFDFCSFYLSLKNKGILKNLVLGDFKFQSGHGLVFGPLFSFGPGANPVRNSAKRPQLQQNASAYEFRNFSGAGATLEKGLFSTSVLVSHIRRDATLYKDIGGDSEYFKAFKTTGYHRTASEMASRGTVGEKHIGVNSDFLSQNGRINLGVNFSLTSFSLPMQKEGNIPDIFEFTGRKSSVYGSYVNLFFNNTLLFSEYAYSGNGGNGFISGITHQFNPEIAISLLYRNYAPSFHSFKSNSFGQKSGNNNEKGLYLGIRVSPLKNLYLRGYFDNYLSKWPDYSADRPVTNREYQISADYSQYRFFQITLANKSIMKEVNFAKTESHFKEIGIFSQQKFIIKTLLYINNNLTWKNRIQWSSTKQQNENTSGFLMSSGINYRNKRLKVAGGISLFDTDDYENRQYLYLNSLPYQYRFGVFQNKGSNVNLALNFHLTENSLLSVSFTQTIYKNLNEISSGQDKITGNKKTELGIQLMTIF